MELVEWFVRRYARRTTKDGIVYLTTNGEPLFQAAFTHLRWADPHPEVATLETATAEAPERAVLPSPKKRWLA